MVAQGLDYGASVDRIMSSPVKTVPALAFCFEALVTMIQEQVDYLAVEHRKEIVGVINAPDMMVSPGVFPTLSFPGDLRAAHCSGPLRLVPEGSNPGPQLA